MRKEIVSKIEIAVDKLLQFMRLYKEDIREIKNKIELLETSLSGIAESAEELLEETERMQMSYVLKRIATLESEVRQLRKMINEINNKIKKSGL